MGLWTPGLHCLGSDEEPRSRVCAHASQSKLCIRPPFVDLCWNENIVLVWLTAVHESAGGRIEEWLARDASKTCSLCRLSLFTAVKDWDECDSLTT
jgi:hypothetical protein